jgi:hypothetical protein
LIVVEFTNIDGISPVNTGAILSNKQCLLFSVSGACPKATVNIITNDSSLYYTFTLENDKFYPAKL